MLSIRLISCYFGTLKPEIVLWLKSCSFNEDISFLFVTDQQVNHVPENVTILNISFDELKTRIKEELKMEIMLEAPYKLCDYKVAYGIIFKKELEGFDYWGYCDSDLVFGRLRNFLTDELLLANEKVFSLGHLSVYRNTQEVCERFMVQDELMDYQQVFSENKIFEFDETPGIYQKYLKHGWTFCDYLPFLDIVWSYNKRLIRYLYTKRLYGVCVKNYPWQIYYYEDGKVMAAYSEDKKTIHHKEFAYIHFSKRSYQFKEPVPEQFYFLPGMIYEKEHGDVTWQEMRSITQNYNCLHERMECLALDWIYRIKRKLR